MSDATSGRRGPLGRLDDTGVPTLLLRLLVGWIFLDLGMEKVSKPVVFLKALKNYDILPLEPAWIMNFTAVALPWIEVAVGVLLILGVARRAAATITFGMLCVFTVAVLKLALNYQAENPGVAFLDIPPLECGCGTEPIRPIVKVAENVGLVLASLWLMVSRSHRFTFRFFSGGTAGGA